MCRVYKVLSRDVFLQLWGYCVTKKRVATIVCIGVAICFLFVIVELTGLFGSKALKLQDVKGC